MTRLCAVCGKLRRMRWPKSASCEACRRRISAGFTVEQAAIMGRAISCDLCGKHTSVTSSDHAHGHCKHKNGCPECYRGELCVTCNQQFLPGIEAASSDLIRKVIEYLSRRPFSRELPSPVHSVCSAQRPAQDTVARMLAGYDDATWFKLREDRKRTYRHAADMLICQWAEFVLLFEKR